MIRQADNFLKQMEEAEKQAIAERQALLKYLDENKVKYTVFQDTITIEVEE